MEQLGVDEVYIDRMSGKNTNRPELQKDDGVRSIVEQEDSHLAFDCG